MKQPPETTSDAEAVAALAKSRAKYNERDKPAPAPEKDKPKVGKFMLEVPLDVLADVKYLIDNHLTGRWTQQRFFNEAIAEKVERLKKEHQK